MNTQKPKQNYFAQYMEKADAIPKWFKDLTKDQQDGYLDDHPNSRLAKQFKERREANKEKKKSSTIHPVSRGQEILLKKGSPTNFTGPESKSTSVSGNPKVDRNIVSKINKLAAVVTKARKEGKNPPDTDLCKVSVPGTNLFCAENKGIPRKDMPQLKGKPIEGSWGDKNLPKDSKGEVDGEAAFKKMLENKGVKITNSMADVTKLKATQSQLVGAKIAGMYDALKKDPEHKGITAPIFVSKDGYILDGHHRWAAMTALDMASGIKDTIKMPVHIVDMDIEDLVNETNKFAEKIGIAAKAGKVKESSKLTVRKELSKIKTHKLIYKIGNGKYRYAFANFTTLDMQEPESVDSLKQAIEERDFVNEPITDLRLVDNEGTTVWSIHPADVGDKTAYSAYKQDLYAPPVKGCGCGC